MSENVIFYFWRWFFIKNEKREPGYKRVINRWALLHLIIGIILSLLVNLDLATSSNTVILPLAMIFVGLSFAWVGNAQALLQSDELIKLSEYREGGIVEYVFAFQTAILVILITIVLWGLAGLKIFDDFWPGKENSILYTLVKIILFASSSLTIRSCWHVVMGVQFMLLAKIKINTFGEDEKKK